MNVQDVLPRDAIPSIDDPAFGSTYFGDANDEVIVVEGDPPRAYPVRVLSYHEIVNDTVDGRPIAVTWCPICWSAVVYDRTHAGRTLTFGVSGTLADDALVMYDRETETEWKQPTGEAIAGELEGERLDALPSAMMLWERFADEYPDGEVLQPVRPAAEYEMAPYEQYVEKEAFGLHGMRGTGEQRSWDRDDLDPKTPVLGVEHGGEAVGYPLPRVEASGGVVTDTVGGLDVVVFAAEGELHAFENPGLAFDATDGGFRADGTAWDPLTGETEDGRCLARVPVRRLFAFAWQDAHGPDAFWAPRNP